MIFERQISTIVNKFAFLHNENQIFELRDVRFSDQIAISC